MSSIFCCIMWDNLYDSILVYSTAAEQYLLVQTTGPVLLSTKIVLAPKQVRTNNNNIHDRKVRHLLALGHTINYFCSQSGGVVIAVEVILLRRHTISNILKSINHLSTITQYP